MRLFAADDAEQWSMRWWSAPGYYLRDWLAWVDRTNLPQDIGYFHQHQGQPQILTEANPHCGIWVDGGFAGSIGCHAATTGSIAIAVWVTGWMPHIRAKASLPGALRSASMPDYLV